MAAAATARRAAPARASARTAPALRTAPVRTAPARKPAPARRRPPAHRPGGQLIPLAVGTAAAVGRLPDSGLVVRMTRGRAWIAVLGVLLTGIVALNVITLSLAASSGRIEQSIQALGQENSVLRSRAAQGSGAALIHREAAQLGLGVAGPNQVAYLRATRQDAAIAARRLAAAGELH